MRTKNAARITPAESAHMARVKAMWRVRKLDELGALNVTLSNIAARGLA